MKKFSIKSKHTHQDFSGSLRKAMAKINLNEIIDCSYKDYIYNQDDFIVVNDSGDGDFIDVTNSFSGNRKTNFFYF